MKIIETCTYQDLLDAIKLLTPEQRRQPIQFTDPKHYDHDKPVTLMPVVAIGTVGDFEFIGSRSVVDNRYHADEVVLLTDSNPFSAAGAVGYTLKSGARSLDENPIYGKGGPTAATDQMANVPIRKPEDDLSRSSLSQVKSRIGPMNRFSR